MADKFAQVMAEIPYVRQCLGWVPLVTPTSQIVGTQAMFNVKFGRWKNLSQPAIDIALGKYGRTPGPIDPAVLALAIQKSGQKPVESRPADALAPRMSKLRDELTTAGLPNDVESCVLHAMFPREFAALYKKPAVPASTATAAAAASRTAPSAAPATTASSNGRSIPAHRYALTVEGRRTEVSVVEVE